MSGPVSFKEIDDLFKSEEEKSRRVARLLSSMRSTTTAPTEAQKKNSIKHWLTVGPYLLVWVYCTIILIQII